MSDTIEQILYNGNGQNTGMPRAFTPPRQRTPLPQENSNTSYNKTSALPPPSKSPRNEPRSGADRNSLRSRYHDEKSIERERDRERERERGNDYPRKDSMKSTDNKRESRSRRGNPNTNGSEAGKGTMTMTGTKDLTDFFSNEVFHIVLHNPTTAHRFLRFCQSRACGENMEFLQKVDTYIRLLDEVTQVLSSIHNTYTSPDAPRQLNLNHSLSKRINADIKYTTQIALPNLEEIFADTQEYVQRLLASDIYPRFVKHQVTASATMALSYNRERYQGLGDCFCLTDPKIADNPIVFASDGFVSVTGYTRKDIIPRNCRFLQGALTDPMSTKRLRIAIDACEETVELLLNYRKDGEPFWNLLYVAPLYNERGEVTFFLGGQINCSTTIHSCTDVLGVLSVRDDELDGAEEDKGRPESVRSVQSGSAAAAAAGKQFPGAGTASKGRSSFFKSFRKYAPNFKSGVSGPGEMGKISVNIRAEAGMENELIKRVGRMNFKTQVEAFYTAYSKYLVLHYTAKPFTLAITHYSPGIIDMLGLNLPNGGIAPIYNQDIFKVLSDHSASSSSSAKAFKNTVKENLAKGSAVSVEIGLLTGYEEVRKGGRWGGAAVGGGNSNMAMVWRRAEERYICHWTPCKDQQGAVGWAVLTIAPKF